jgi:trimethylamine:corrinoid methyltransferase-like protein
MHAEVHVRTVLQHAWAAISHSLQYKKEDDVPAALRRRLNRLAALLELADQEFTTLSAEHRALHQSRDPDMENVQMILGRALRSSAHSYEWIRSNTPLNYSDEEFEALFTKKPETFESVRIVRRDENGERIIPGKPGIRLRRS